MAVRRSTRHFTWLAAALAAPTLFFSLASFATPAGAQIVGTDPRNRNCQTLLVCNYTRGGVYRGCLSSYTCRTCRAAPVRCTASDLATGRTRCTELVCTWGG